MNFGFSKIWKVKVERNREEVIEMKLEKKVEMEVEIETDNK